MNYAKKFGDFDTGQNPKIFNYFKVWNDGDKLIVYKRILNHLQIYEEEFIFQIICTNLNWTK